MEYTTCKCKSCIGAGKDREREHKLDEVERISEKYYRFQKQVVEDRNCIIEELEKLKKILIEENIHNSRVNKFIRALITLIQLGKEGAMEQQMRESLMSSLVEGYIDNCLIEYKK